MAGLDILICGAGIAGPTLALLLSRSSTKHNITIVERSPTLRTTGQQVDLRLSAITINQRLGLLEDLKDITTEETGVAFVDSNNNVKAAYPVEKGGETQGFSSEYEILRGKYAELLYEKTKDLPQVRYIFGDRVETIDQNDSNVHVTFKNGAPSASYDLLVAADGQNSRTREIAWKPPASSSMNEETKSPFKSLDMYMAYFSMPIYDSDLHATESGMARWFNAPGRRNIFVRPDHRGKQRTSTYLSIVVPPRTPNKSAADQSTGPDVKQTTRQRLDAAIRDYTNISSQKALFRELFTDAGWETERILDGMDKSDDFYMQEIAQVRLGPAKEPPNLAWSRGRVVCLGDAGYCPTPIAGVGTSLAVTGAYVLAGEIAQAMVSDREDKIISALSKYEKILKPYIDKAQRLAPGVPRIINPETAWGIRTFHGIMGFMDWTGLTRLMMKLGAGTGKEAFEFSQYEELNIPSEKKP